MVLCWKPEGEIIALDAPTPVQGDPAYPSVAGGCPFRLVDLAFAPWTPCAGAGDPGADRRSSHREPLPGDKLLVPPHAASVCGHIDPAHASGDRRAYDAGSRS